MFCRIPCAKGWSELQENIRGRGGSQWIITTGDVGAGALTRPAMRSIARRWRARLASPDEGVRAYVRRGGWAQERCSHKQKHPDRREWQLSGQGRMNHPIRSHRFDE